MSTEVTAYHEAGHMCAAWELGLRVEGATIVPDPEQGYSGCVLCPIEDRVRDADWVDEDEYLYSHLVMIFAGPAASDKHTGVPTTEREVQILLDTSGGDSDYNNATDLILALAGSDQYEQEKIGDRAHSHATFFVATRWERIERTARELLLRETLDEAECREVLENAFSN